MGTSWVRSAARDDRGQTTPFAAAMVALCAVALVALVPAARALDDRARARTAADAAALAGAADGESAAREVAESQRRRAGRRAGQRRRDGGAGPGRRGRGLCE